MAHHVGADSEAKGMKFWMDLNNVGDNGVEFALVLIYN